MKLSTKIYLSFLAIFSLILLILLIVGLIKNNETNTSSTQTTQPQPTYKELDAESKKELAKLQKRLQELETINQQNISNNKKLKEEDNQLSQQINSNLETIKNLNLQISNLNKELEQKTKELNNKETNLTDEQKTTLKTELNNLTNEITNLTQQRDNINNETKPLTLKRVANTQSQIINKNIIQTNNLEIDKNAQFKEIYEQINTLQEVINYNNANKELIKEQITKHQDYPQEVQNLKSYDLFLDDQLFTFKKQIKQLQNEIQILKDPNTPKLEKKK